MPRGSSTALRFARNDITAVLLAGGESHRMGIDKATLLFRGKSLWENQLDLLRKMKPSQILVSARTDPSWRPADIEFVADVLPSCGPLSGLAASLAKMRTAHLLALAIDMPFMTQLFLRCLCKRIDTACGVVPKIGDRYEPLAAIYPQEAATDVRNALAGTDFSLQSAVHGLVNAGKLQTLHLAAKEKKLFLNVNKPSDLQSM